MVDIDWSSTLPLNLPATENIDTKPGVYRLSYQSAEGPLYVFFIGRSDVSIKEDLQKLVSKTTDNICVKTHLENLECYFKYAIVEEEASRKNIERTLYEYFKPKCNLTIPDGEVIEDIKLP